LELRGLGLPILQRAGQADRCKRQRARSSGPELVVLLRTATPHACIYPRCFPARAPSPIPMLPPCMAWPLMSAYHECALCLALLEVRVGRALREALRVVAVRVTARVAVHYLLLVAATERSFQ
jgi:hypothetical protein